MEILPYEITSIMKVLVELLVHLRNLQNTTGTQEEKDCLEDVVNYNIRIFILVIMVSWQSTDPDD